MALGLAVPPSDPKADPSVLDSAPAVPLPPTDPKAQPSTPISVVDSGFAAAAAPTHGAAGAPSFVAGQSPSDSVRK